MTCGCDVASLIFSFLLVQIYIFTQNYQHVLKFFSLLSCSFEYARKSILSYQILSKIPILHIFVSNLIFLIKAIYKPAHLRMKIPQQQVDMQHNTHWTHQSRIIVHKHVRLWSMPMYHDPSYIVHRAIEEFLEVVDRELHPHVVHCVNN